MRRVKIRIKLLAVLIVLLALSAQLAAAQDAAWDSRFDTNGMSSSVNALALGNGFVYAGGVFTVAGLTPASRIARWNNATWQALGGGLSGTVNAIAVSGNDVYVGGNFTTAGGGGPGAGLRFVGPRYAYFQPAISSTTP